MALLGRGSPAAWPLSMLLLAVSAKAQVMHDVTPSWTTTLSTSTSTTVATVTTPPPEVPVNFPINLPFQSANLHFTIVPVNDTSVKCRVKQCNNYNCICMDASGAGGPSAEWAAWMGLAAGVAGLAFVL